MKSLRLASSTADVVANILGYGAELDRVGGLQELLSMAPAWYACRDANSGEWRFAPSKYVGYVGMNGAAYLANNGRDGEHDGRKTERQLEKWFKPVGPDSALHRQLMEKLTDLLSDYGKAPNKRCRFSVPISDSETTVARDLLSDQRIGQPGDWIVFDPSICAGKPTLRGTRIRVSDVLQLLAGGDAIETILMDYPSLRRHHIDAALSYAAAAVDHRVIRAA
jgi:uncharacterized protein (DUF433 family)